MYVKVENGNVVSFPYGPEDLKRGNPDISFPEPMPDERLEDFGIFPVSHQEIPQPFDDVTQNAVQCDPVLLGGVWTQTWSIVPASADETAQRLENIAQDVRAKRNDLLGASDWTQLPDSPVDKAVWAVYRAALRDIPNQVGFPRSVVWPTI